MTSFKCKKNLSELVNEDACGLFKLFLKCSLLRFFIQFLQLLNTPAHTAKRALLNTVWCVNVSLEQVLFRKQYAHGGRRMRESAL